MKTTVLVALFATLILALSCSRESSIETDAANPAARATTSERAPASPAAHAEEPNLLGFAAGALIVIPPENQGWFDGNYGPYNMVNEKGDDYWLSPQDSSKREQVMVVAVPARTQFTRFEIDTAPAGDQAVKQVRIEISDSSAREGFQALAEAALEKNRDGQQINAGSPQKGRWVRFTFIGSHGGGQLALGGIRGFGSQDTITSLGDVSGTYEFEGEQPWHIQADGGSIAGCYEGNYEGLLSGGVEGQTIKLRWTENDQKSGSMLVNFAPGGEAAVFSWADSENPSAPIGPAVKYGKRISNEVGSCEHWSPKGALDQQLVTELEQKGRAIVYGINFDPDSDVIRPDSKPTLEKIAAILKAKPDWKFSIEGHTDSTSTPEHNQRLSERRAVSVKATLVGMGIVQARMTTSGHGAGTPVAPNDTPTGRAQNRRVELVKS